MSTSYSGAIIRVRRAGDNAQADIGVTAGDVLDQTALGAHCGSNLGYVAKSYDQSGNGRDLVQSDASTQPQIWDGAAVVVASSGKPAAYFNSFNLLKTANATANQSLMIYWVGQNVTWVSSRSIFDGDSINSMLCYQFNATNEMSFYAGGGNLTNTVDSFAPGTIFIMTGRFSGVDSFMKKNNGTARTGNPGTSPAAGFTVGGRGDTSSKAECFWSEAILYHSAAHDTTTQSTIVNGENGFYTVY